MYCKAIPIAIERSQAGWLLVTVCVLTACAATSVDGRRALKHVGWWGVVAVCAGAHRWLAWFSPVHYLRDLERSFGPNTPVLMEHFVGGILCVWAASIVLRILPWMSAELRRMHADRPLPAWNWAAMAICLIFAIVFNYVNAQPTLLSWIPVLMLGVCMVALGVAPARASEWASHHRGLLVVVLAFAAWAKLCLEWGACQYLTQSDVVAHNAVEQLTASLSGLALTALVRWRMAFDSADRNLLGSAS